VTFSRTDTLAGYARTAVDLKIRMTEHCESPHGLDYVRAWHDANWAGPLAAVDGAPPADHMAETIHRATAAAWRHGEPFVLAPAMTAIIAAAADALDLTGDLLTADAAPCDGGVLFLPDPIWHHTHGGNLHSIAAITWTPLTVPGAGRSWLICGWAARDDPADPNADERRGYMAQDPTLRARLGPYLLAEVNLLPIALPLLAPHIPDGEPPPDREWSSALDGRYVISDHTGRRTQVCVAIAYAFWRIQAQPIASASRPPLHRAGRRRALRASIVHDTRVVMLRRTSPLGDRADGDAKWHYRVRFYVKGHWRHLIDKNGRPYRVWVNGHIKGPDGAPLLHGEKVAVLAR
jgi:hypothetical protein